MCTVTAIPTRAGFRLACNRDESRLRPIAQPPAVEQFGEREALLPRDPAGGTWIGANDRALVLTLLNYNPATRNGFIRSTTPAAQTRGLIILSLLECANVFESLVVIRHLDVSRFGPFRLLMLDGRNAAEVVSDSHEAGIRYWHWDRAPLLLTSSGLGDALVQGPREALFREMLLNPRFDDDGARIAAQDAFHAHRWPDRPHLSVWMERHEARTVSCTTVDVGAGMRMAYWPAPPAAVPVEAVAAHLPLRHAAFAGVV